MSTPYPIAIKRDGNIVALACMRFILPRSTPAPASLGARGERAAANSPYASSGAQSFGGRG